MADMDKQQQQPMGKQAAPKPLYGECTFQRVARANVFQNRNGKSCAAINVTVPVLALGLVLETAIWARFKQTTDGHEVSFEASLPRGLKAATDGSDEALLAHIETQAAGWKGYEAATAAAYNLLTGSKQEPKQGEAARPRLVYKPIAAADGKQQPPSA